MVRRGSTVRVRQRAFGFFLLRCWFRFRGRRRIPDSTSTERPPTSTACSWDPRTVSGRGPGAARRERGNAMLASRRQTNLRFTLVFGTRARVKLIRTTSPVKPRRLDGRCDADAARLRTLRPFLHFVLDLRALREALVARALDRAVVDEHVLAPVIGRDEAVALVVAKPLHGSGCHLDTSLDRVTNVQRKAQAKTGTRSHSPVVADDTSSRRTHPIGAERRPRNGATERENSLISRRNGVFGTHTNTSPQRHAAVSFKQVRPRRPPRRDLHCFRTTVRLENEAFPGVNQSFETLHHGT